MSPQLGVLKSTLLQLDSTFSERELRRQHVPRFRPEARRAGYVTLKGTDRNLYVELREGTEGAPTPREPGAGCRPSPRHPEPMPERVTESAPEPAPAPVDITPRRADEPDSQLAILPAPLLAQEPDLDELDAAAYAAAHGMPAPRPGHAVTDAMDGMGRDNATVRRGRATAMACARGAPGAGRAGAQAGQGGAPPPVADPALQAEGYRAMERVFLKPGAVTRWPLYLRQAKAVLRAGDEGFDERRYGFAGLVEALRFGQREGLFRLDRDRQGVLRVYPGELLQRAEGGGVMTGMDGGPAHHEPQIIDSPAPAARAEEPMDVAEPIQDTPAAASSDAGDDEAAAPKGRSVAPARRRTAAAKKAAPKARAAKAPAAARSAPPRRRA